MLCAGVHPQAATLGVAPLPHGFFSSILVVVVAVVVVVLVVLVLAVGTGCRLCSRRNRLTHIIR